jgi:uncharacterized protein YndB with AHSA1/START domain
VKDSVRCSVKYLVLNPKALTFGASATPGCNSSSASGVRHKLSVPAVTGTGNAFLRSMQHLRLLPDVHPEGIRAVRQRFDDEFSTAVLSFEVSIQADARRLFHALTTPEYLEAWLCLPGERPGCSIIAASTGQDFVIEHSCDGAPSVLISGRYLVCRRRSLAFSWRVDGDLNVCETKVDIRLRGEFERTKLMLRHSGFASRHDFAWHRILWNASLSRLAALFGSTDRQQEPAVTRHDDPGMNFRHGSELAS